MKKKPYVGIRIKALLAVVLLVLVPSLFLAVVTYHIRDDAVNMVRENTVKELSSSMREYVIKLNKNATSWIDNYMKSIEIEGRSAANMVPEYLGKDPATEALWGSRGLLEQVNTTMLMGIMNGTIRNQYYDQMVSRLDKGYVDSVLNYFINPPELDYSTAHVNESAYNAINDLKSQVGDHGLLLYDFLRSVLLPEYRERLDSILPVGNMLYAFREVPDLLWSYFATPDGYFVLTPTEAEVSPLFNPLVRNWYLDAVKNGVGTWSMEYIDEITKNPMITFSVPVYINGTLAGVLGFDLLLSTLSEKTREFYTGGKSFAFTVSMKGTALTYPDERIIGKSLIEGDGEFNTSVSMIINSTEGGMNTSIDGDKVFLAYSTIGATGWKFVNVVYCEEIMEKSRASADEVGRIVDMEIMYLISIIVSVGLIAFIVTFFLVDGTVRDLENLTRIADEVSKGNLDVRVEVNGKDEIGELQKAIKRMVNSIKVAMEELEEGEQRGR